MAVVVRKQQQSANKRTYYPAKAIERLGEVDASLGAVFTAKYGDVWIGGGLKACQSAANDKERK